MKRVMARVAVVCILSALLISCPKQKSSAPVANFAGQWESNWGLMVLTQQGDKVRGTYEHDQGQLEGTVTGNRLEFGWTELPSRTPPNDAGDGYFVLAPDGNSFKGQWRYGNSGEWQGDWEATRKQ